MFPAWRLKIRAAQIALQEGRCDEASALLSRDSVREFLPAKRLSREVATQLVERAGTRIAAGDSMAGWQDIDRASRLGGCAELIEHFRTEQAQQGIERTRRYLECGETALAERQIAKLERRHLGGEERRRWKQIVRTITHAKQRAYAGEFAEADELLTQATRMLPGPKDPLAAEIAARQQQLRANAGKLHDLTPRLHDALTASDWREVLTQADAVLELAPEYQPALVARKRAWNEVGIRAYSQRQVKPVPLRAHASTVGWCRLAKNPAIRDEVMIQPSDCGKRMIAWIDEVGAFLLCLGDRVVIGQPSPEGGVDIAVRADLSRRHATIHRDGENYVLTPIHTCRLDSTPLAGPAVLRDGALVQLGDSLEMRFTKPHTLSASAVLRIESKHKTEPAVDAVVLMSESCVLGARSHSHIPCPQWTDDLVLFRRGEQMQFRSSNLVELNDHPGTTTGPITDFCRIAGEDFALSFEEI